MRTLLTVVLGVVLIAAGCSKTDTPAPANIPSEPPNRTEYTHTIQTETTYYTTGPQQGRPPDGNLRAGTKVKFVKESGSYSQVETEAGVRAYIASESLQEIQEE